MRIRLPALAVFLASLILVGCGDDHDAPLTGTNTQTGVTPPTANPKSRPTPKPAVKPVHVPSLISASGCHRPGSKATRLGSNAAAIAWEKTVPNGGFLYNTLLYGCSRQIGKVFLVQQFPDPEYEFLSHIEVVHLTARSVRYRVEQESAAADCGSFDVYEVSLLDGSRSKVRSGRTGTEC